MLERLRTTQHTDETTHAIVLQINKMVDAINNLEEKLTPTNKQSLKCLCNICKSDGTKFCRAQALLNNRVD